MQLGLTIVRFIVAQLVHCFDWELPCEMKAEDMDMTEKFGLSMGRANNLLAKPAYHLLPNTIWYLQCVWLQWYDKNWRIGVVWRLKNLSCFFFFFILILFSFLLHGFVESRLTLLLKGCVVGSNLALEVLFWFVCLLLKWKLFLFWNEKSFLLCANFFFFFFVIMKKVKFLQTVFE